MLDVDKEEEVLRAAHDLFVKNPDWVTFFRRILGMYGIVRRLFPAKQELLEFEQSETYDEIQQLLCRLRERATVSPVKQEPTRVITVRLPRSLHEALKEEAFEHKTSMNKLCITKLLQIIDADRIPPR